MKRIDSKKHLKNRNIEILQIDTVVVFVFVVAVFNTSVQGSPTIIIQKTNKYSHFIIVIIIK